MPGFLDSALSFCAGRGPTDRLHRRLFEKDHQRYMAGSSTAAEQAQSELESDDDESEGSEGEMPSGRRARPTSTQQQRGIARIFKPSVFQRSRPARLSSQQSSKTVPRQPHLPEYGHLPKFKRTERTLLPAQGLLPKQFALELTARAEKTTFPVPSPLPAALAAITPANATATPANSAATPSNAAAAPSNATVALSPAAHGAVLTEPPSSTSKSSSGPSPRKPSFLYEIPPLPPMVGIGRYRRSATASDEWVSARLKEIDIRDPWIVPELNPYHPGCLAARRRAEKALLGPTSALDPPSLNSLVGDVTCSSESAANSDGGSSTTTTASLEAARAWSWNHSWRDELLDKDTTICFNSALVA
ncbi:MAG: hypothetical protein M1829_005767 [Trizodia sp. TS-e1964]|nr:MAG: hypothetical protein M1829_005767 [Trizodia sp. TS-e1964]